MAALEERGGSKISIPNILTIFILFYVSVTETAEGVGNMTLILTFGETLRPRRLKDGYFGIKLSERFLAGVLRCEYSGRVRGERVYNGI